MTRVVGMVPSRRARRIVVGISGATGFAYGVCALRLLRGLGLETHLVVSRAGDLTRDYESSMSREELWDGWVKPGLTGLESQSTGRQKGLRARTGSSSDQSPCSTTWPCGNGGRASRPSDTITRSSR
jgi:3-polyprenyl-4-hydroxybenzoate decarboxylase